MLELLHNHLHPFDLDGLLAALPVVWTMAGAPIRTTRAAIVRFAIWRERYV